MRTKTLAAGLIVLWVVLGYVGGPAGVAPWKGLRSFLPGGLLSPVIQAATGDITEFPIPTANSAPVGITAGPDGNLWFTEQGINKIGRITTSGLVIDEFPVPTAASTPWRITPGPDGNLWFAELTGHKIGRITTSGVVTEFSIPTANSAPSGITAGPDGNLWFTERDTSKIGRITPTGTITEFSLPAGSAPNAITAGPDGNLWFTEQGSNKIGRMTPTGSLTEFAVPTANSQPVGITTGSDGNLWFTEVNAHQIGRITPTGTITEFPVPTPNSLPARITTGPDGNVWFTEAMANQIGRLEAAAAKTAYVLAIASGFSPKTRAMKKQGDTMQWSFYGPTTQTATDSSGMGLFDSGVKSLVSFYSFTFIAAGTYPYKDTLHPTHKGTIKVPMKVNPSSGPPSTVFKVRWASATPPLYYVFDVQINPLGGGFVDWKVGETAKSANFSSSDPFWAGPGTYEFRARLRNTLNGNASGYSPAKSITVSP